METSLCSKQMEMRCAEQVSSLADWVIEYAWSHRMMDVLEGLVLCKGLECGWQSLTLEEPCTLRVAAAQAWSVVNARDVKHFESLLELLESIYTLAPRLITHIKHMKIMFGLKTMIVMWMLQKNHGEVGTMKKINRFFPSSLSLYHGCSKRELYQMKKSHYEFKLLAQSLLFHKEMRKTYISSQMEEHYGERYAQKLEERLYDYLQLLEKDLQPTTCLDQVLRQERPLVEGEQLLLGVLSCSPHCVPAALKRLLYYAKATTSSGPGMSQPSTCTEKEKQTVQPLTDHKERPKQTPLPTVQPGQVRSSMSHSRWKGRGKEKAMSSCAGGGSEKAEQRLRNYDLTLSGWSHGAKGHSHEKMGLSQDKRGWEQKEKGHGQMERRWGPWKGRQSWGRTKLAEQHCQMGDYPMQPCFRHKRWVRNILQECSVEVGDQSMVILTEKPKETGCQTVNIIEQCKKEVGCQTVNIMEQGTEESMAHSIRILEKCSQEFEDQNGIILEQSNREMGCQTVNIGQCPQKLVGMSILETCSQEVMRHSVSDLEECYEMERRDQGVIEHQQVLPLTSPQPATSLHPYHSPWSYQGCDKCTASPLARVETVGLGVRISMESQQILIQSQMLQPTVWIKRLTQRECHHATYMRGTINAPELEKEGRDNEEDEGEEEGESYDWESDFSYSQFASGSDSDLDYNPLLEQ